LSEYPRDPFRFMATHAKTYAFNILFMQAQPVFIRDLWRTVKDFIATSRMQPASMLDAFVDRSRDYKCAAFPRLTPKSHARGACLREVVFSHVISQSHHHTLAIQRTALLGQLRDRVPPFLAERQSPSVPGAHRPVGGHLLPYVTAAAFATPQCVCVCVCPCRRSLPCPDPCRPGVARCVTSHGGTWTDADCGRISPGVRHVVLPSQACTSDTAGLVGSGVTLVCPGMLSAPRRSHTTTKPTRWWTFV
jgi:hypothetical protein